MSAPDEAADTGLVEAIRRAVAGASYLDPSLGALVAAAPETAALQELQQPGAATCCA